MTSKRPRDDTTYPSIYHSSDDDSIDLHNPHEATEDQVFDLPVKIFDIANPLFKRHRDCPVGVDSDVDDYSQAHPNTVVQDYCARPYHARVNDPDDFASVWETTLVGCLAHELRQHSPAGFSVDVQTFPELAGSDISRVIFITTSAMLEAPTKESIENIIMDNLPRQFKSTKIMFCEGEVRKSTGWLGTSNTHPDVECPPKHAIYRELSTMGVSIGLEYGRDTASVGGFIRIGEGTFATSAFHPFEDMDVNQNLQVCHPSDSDLIYNMATRSSRGQKLLGVIEFASGAQSFRRSRIFNQVNQSRELTMVEMDWVAIRMPESGANVLPILAFPITNKRVAVQGYAEVQGNTEVYAMGRTSGYSLGFTSEVPGLQYWKNIYHREWTVRQYSPGECPANCEDACCNSLRWQTVKDWVTSGIGAPGDSGAWLVRRSDNHVIGHVWGRQTSYGPLRPMMKNRLTYFTPFVDMKADIEDQSKQTVALSPDEPESLCPPLGQVNPLQLLQNVNHDPWNTLSMDPLDRNRKKDLAFINRIGAQPSSFDCLQPLVREGQATYPVIPASAASNADDSSNQGSSVQVAANSTPSSAPAKAEYPSGRRILPIGADHHHCGLSDTPSLALSCPTAISDGSADSSFVQDVEVAVGEDGLLDGISQLRRSKAPPLISEIEYLMALRA